MGKREIAGAILIAALALGGTAMTQVGPTLFPNDAQTIFWIGVTLVLSALMGLAWLYFSAPKSAMRGRKSARPVSSTRRSQHDSTFIKASEAGDIDLEDIQTDADNFVVAKKMGRFSARRVDHRKGGS